MPYLLLDGTFGSFASAPYRSEYNEPSILDLRGEIDFDSYIPGDSQTIVARWAGPSAVSPWRLLVANGGKPILVMRDSALNLYTLISSVNPGLSPGTPVQLRSTVDTTLGEVKFYQRAIGTALIDDSSWTQIGSTLALAAADILQPTETGINVGATNTTGNIERAAGKIYRVVVKKGAVTGGTPIFDPNFSDTTTWVFS